MRSILKSILVLSFGLFIFSSCENSTVTTGNGSEKITLSGKITTEKRDVKSFKAIQLEGVFNVTLSQGTTEELTISTDENLQKVILVEMVSDTLIVKLKEDIKIDKMKEINVAITIADISKIDMKSVGTLKCAGQLNLKELELKVEGVGTTNLDLKAEKLNIRSEIVGALKLSGEVAVVTIKHSGIGAVNALDLKSKMMDLKVDGVGGADVYATDELTIDASGVGNVRYKGNPAKKNIKADGVGKVFEQN